MPESKKTKPAVWGYKKTEDGYDSRIFKDGELPKGWKDTPAGMSDDNRS